MTPEDLKIAAVFIVLFLALVFGVINLFAQWTRPVFSRLPPWIFDEYPDPLDGNEIADDVLSHRIIEKP